MSLPTSGRHVAAQPCRFAEIVAVQAVQRVVARPADQRVIAGRAREGDAGGDKIDRDVVLTQAVQSQIELVTGQGEAVRSGDLNGQTN